MLFMVPRIHTDIKKMANFELSLKTICDVSANHLQTLVTRGIQAISFETSFQSKPISYYLVGF